MAEKEYIEREKLPERKGYWDDDFGAGWDACLDAIDSIHAADVRPVVLCKDCRHRDPEDGKCDAGAVERAGCVFPVGDNYFCAYGEKRDVYNGEFNAT